MRPRKLSLTAFGPFGDTVDVDFDDLSSFGVFRIHGDTGAGKTSLLDGMTFALFGQVSGSRLVGGLRSQHAESTTETVVSLEFSANGHDWRIVRKPPQIRAAKRGGGLKEDKYQTASLVKRSGDTWTPVATKLGEVNNEIRELIGLDHQQFTQVVVLPQGEFQKALRATSEERMKLLRTLFGTERFDVYARRLKERADLLRAKRESLRTGLEEVDAAARRRAADLDLDDAVEDGPIETPEAIRPLVDGARDQLRATRDSLNELAERDAALRKELEQLNVAAQNHQRRVGAVRRLQMLTEQEGDIELARAELEAAHKVASAVPALERLQATQRRAGLVQHRLAEARDKYRKALSLSPQDLPERATRLADPDVTSLEAGAVVASIEVSATNAERNLQRLERVAAHLLEADEQSALAQKLQSELQSTEASVSDCEQLITQLSEEFEAVGKVQPPDVLRKRLEHLDAQLDAANKAEQLSNELLDLEKAAVTSKDADNTAHTEYLNLVERRLANMAGELSARLVDGEPCTVCGSTEHPHPAQSPPEGADAATVESALRHWETLCVATKQAEAAVNAARQERAALTSKAGTALSDVGAFTNERETTSADLNVAIEAKHRVVQLERDIDSARTRLSAAQQALTKHQASLTRAQALADSARRQALALSSDSVTMDDVAAARLNHQFLVSLSGEARSLAGVVEQSEQADGAVRDDEAHLQDIASRMQIEDLATISSAARNEAALESLKQRIEQWDHSRAAAQQTLEDHAVANAVDAPDLNRVQAMVSEVSSDMARQNERVGLIQSALRELERLHDQLRDHDRNYRSVEVAYDKATRLSDICNGAVGSKNRMSLERYVLAAHLEEVAAVASKRLLAMTEGRFSLRHSDAGAARNAASGLGLLVGDSHTGDEREVSTLSGGETFLASLALALALSDVVQQHAGGVRMDVLFVDEGFGSLDSGKLELAMAHLDQVRAGGRVVGIISHVADLKDRIPAGVEVTHGLRGSTLRTASALSPAV